MNIANEIVDDVPCSLENALTLTNEARVICGIGYPHNVVFANKAWTMLTGYHQHEVEGKPLMLLQGPKTDLITIKEMMHNVRLCGFGSAEVINYNKDKSEYGCKILIQPVVSENIFGEKQISHLLGRIYPHQVETTPKIMPDDEILRELGGVG